MLKRQELLHDRAAKCCNEACCGQSLRTIAVNRYDIPRTLFTAICGQPLRQFAVNRYENSPPAFTTVCGTPLRNYAAGRGAVPEQPVAGAIPWQYRDGPWALPKRARINIGQSIDSHCVSWDNIGTALEHSQDDPCAIMGQSYDNSDTATVDSGSDQPSCCDPGTILAGDRDLTCGRPRPHAKWTFVPRRLLYF